MRRRNHDGFCYCSLSFPANGNYCTFSSLIIMTLLVSFFCIVLLRTLTFYARDATLFYLWCLSLCSCRNHLARACLWRSSRTQTHMLAIQGLFHGRTCLLEMTCLWLWIWSNSPKKDIVSKYSRILIYMYGSNLVILRFWFSREAGGSRSYFTRSWSSAGDERSPNIVCSRTTTGYHHHREKSLRGHAISSTRWIRQ